MICLLTRDEFKNRFSEQIKQSNNESKIDFNNYYSVAMQLSIS